MSLIKKLILSVFLSAILVLSVSAIWAYASLPSLQNLEGCFTTSMFQVELCPKNSDYVRYNQLPKHLVQALIASEDATFFYHQGFDWDEISDSLQKSMDAGRWVRGGSTLTQQLAKNLYLSGEKSIVRKIKEFYIAHQIEERLSKAQIIEKYFNVVEFAEKIYGIRKGAQYYFQKSPSELTAAESAYLVSLLPNPKKYSSSFRKSKSLSAFNKRRCLHILEILKLQNHLDESSYEHEIARVENGLWTPLSELREVPDSSSTDLTPLLDDGNSTDSTMDEPEDEENEDI